MATTLKISAASLAALFAVLGDAGRRILGPAEVDGRIELKAVRTLAEVAGDQIQPVLSAKETAFPRVERLLSYRMAPGKVELQDYDPEVQPTVLFGLRPCEAAGFNSLDKPDLRTAPGGRRHRGAPKTSAARRHLPPRHA